MAPASNSQKNSKSTKQGIVMTIVFIAVVIAIAIALLMPSDKPPQMDAKNPKEEAIETYVWQVYGLDILPKDAICAETTMQHPVLNCVITVKDVRNVKKDLRFWCSIEHDICVEQYEQLAGLIEGKEKETMGKSAKDERREAISKSVKDN
jgi:hypothetical protein